MGSEGEDRRERAAVLKSTRSILIVRTFSITAFLGLALLLPADGALAQTNVDPDDVFTDLAADGYDSNCAVNCSVSADLPNSTLMASTTAGESETNDVEAILSASFDVSAESEDPEDETKLVGSTISLSVSADGALTASGTDSSAGYRLDVQVVDTSESDMLVATQKIGESSVTNGTEDVLLLEPVVLPVSLTRGHSYSVELVLFLKAAGDDTPGSASAEFASTASWDDLTIAAGSDVFGAIADLDGRVEKLETDVADLREDFENHTHEYLTGKGVGHNNTVATTTHPDSTDGNGVSPDWHSDDGGSTLAPPPVVEEEEDQSGGWRRSSIEHMGLSDRRRRR
jgi:hypothetical protein